MPKASGYTRYQCERTNYHKAEGGKVEYLAGNDTGDWTEVKRVDASGIDRSYYLCGECTTAYKALVTQQDTDFKAFQNAEKGA